MAVQFPDPNVTTTYTNPDTGEVYNWNPISGGWRRAQGASGGSEIPDPSNPDKQPGTLDDRYVNIIGDTMTGPLVQRPDTKTDPAGTGNLSTNTPRDTSLEFRYQGSDDVVRCVTLPLGCCQTVTQRTHIEIQGGGSGFALVGDVLEITENATIDPSSAIEATQWQRETGAGTFVFEDIVGQTGQTYTVDAGDLGLLIRVRESFLVGQECEKVVPSNVIAITSSAPPKTDFVGVTFDKDTLKMEMTLTANAEVYREDNGNWVLETTLTAGTGVKYETSTPGFYIVESDNMTALRFSYGGEVGDYSIKLTLDERSYMDAITDASFMFANHKDFNQDLSWWDTSNVTTLESTFENCIIFNQVLSSWDTSQVTSLKNTLKGTHQNRGSVEGWNTSNVLSMSGTFWDAPHMNSNLSGWDVSNVTDMFALFYTAGRFRGNGLETWDTSNVTNMQAIFSGSYLAGTSIEAWDVSSVQNFSEMFLGTKTTDWSPDLSNWNTVSATTMDRMFFNQKSFTGDISSWCVPLISNKPVEFDGGTNVAFKNHPEIQPQWGTCPPKILTNPVIQ